MFALYSMESYLTKIKEKNCLTKLWPVSLKDKCFGAMPDSFHAHSRGMGTLLFKMSHKVMFVVTAPSLQFLAWMLVRILWTSDSSLITFKCWYGFSRLRLSVTLHLEFVRTSSSEGHSILFFHFTLCDISIISIHARQAFCPWTITIHLLLSLSPF